MTVNVPELPEIPDQPQDAYDFYGVNELYDEIEQDLREYGIELDFN